VPASAALLPAAVTLQLAAVLLPAASAVRR
jgi:hypothetical protein